MWYQVLSESGRVIEVLVRLLRCSVLLSGVLC